MSLQITKECINCGACDETCPTAAISEDTENAIRVVDPLRCTECVGFYERTMCQVECPIECCVADPNIQETSDTLFIKARQLYPEYPFPSPPPSHSK
ncbi:MAG: 4Fe-4S dicluster domain-containing protein [Deltaproteobacteria bacterium]|nr:4Fe-4S dicluster domain-containing protein [Deltaproteobacteria bacterium]